VLNAEIGKYVTMARKDRNSEEWYIGSITNEDPRTLEINLAFLDDSLDYRAEIYADGEQADYRTNPDPVTISTRVVNSTMQLGLKLAAGGGTAIRLVPVR
jgi:alpha-glucosidase